MKLVINSLLYFFGVAANPISDISYGSDADAMRADWENVGRDIQSAVTEYEQEQ